jgi:hypothetical protein
MNLQREVRCFTVVAFGGPRIAAMRSVPEAGHVYRVNERGVQQSADADEPGSLGWPTENWFCVGTVSDAPRVFYSEIVLTRFAV